MSGKLEAKKKKGLFLIIIIIVFPLLFFLFFLFIINANFKPFFFVLFCYHTGYTDTGRHMFVKININKIIGDWRWENFLNISTQS
jgi:hypothetical protein